MFFSFFWGQSKKKPAFTIFVVVLVSPFVRSFFASIYFSTEFFWIIEIPYLCHCDFSRFILIEYSFAGFPFRLFDTFHSLCAPALSTYTHAPTYTPSVVCRSLRWWCLLFSIRFIFIKEMKPECILCAWFSAYTCQIIYMNDKEQKSGYYVDCK